MKKLLALAVPATFVAILAIACGGDEKKPPVVAKAPPPAEAPTTQTTGAQNSDKMAVNVDSDIVKQCNLKFDNLEDAPKFDYNSDELTPGEKTVLEAVAKCLTTGPLKGKSVDLVGRADPRGETEYNMTLGAKRARQVHSFLGNLGVPQDKLRDTSRGELDAQGKDEEGWRKDRRVDVRLTK